MKEFKGTPGPWEVSIADWDENGDASYSLRGVKDVWIHDARLIEAAPDMFEALQDLVNDLVNSDDEGLIEHAEPMIAARAAIAKALGE